ncbi:MAG: hypothetical protein ABFS16_15120, partial [Bacteroidota bacterium]
KKALKHFNHGIRYCPNDKALLYIRGLCRYELGDENGARKDWNRIVDLGGIDFRKTASVLKEMKGYAEMAEILENSKGMTK